jgi:CRP/FNR family cyclic AMP-dependent transcriptional regulator
MSADLFAELDALAIPVTVPKGAILFRSGDPASAVYFVRKGTIVLAWAGRDDVHPMDTLGPGSIIGLPAALNGQYSITARTLVESELGYIPVAVFTELLEGNPKLMKSATKLLGQEVARMRSLLTSVSARKKRLAARHQAKERWRSG